MKFGCLECCSKFTLSLDHSITLPSSINIQGMHGFDASSDDNLLTEQLVMQDLSRLFGHHHLDRYEINHSPSFELYPIDLPTDHSNVRLQATKSELVLMIEFKVISDSRLEAIREVRPGKAYEGRVFEFALNGTVHGKRVAKEGLEFRVTGSEIIQAIEKRVG